MANLANLANLATRRLRQQAQWKRRLRGRRSRVCKSARREWCPAAPGGQSQRGYGFHGDFLNGWDVDDNRNDESGFFYKVENLVDRRVTRAGRAKTPKV